MSNFVNNHDVGYISTNSDYNPIRICFEYLFNDDVSLIDRNEYVFLFLQNYLISENYNLINDFLLDSAWYDLHSSLLKSALIMTHNNTTISNSSSKLQLIYNSKVSKKK